MKINYSTRGLLAFTTLVGITAFLQLRLSRNIDLLKNELSAPSSQLHKDISEEDTDLVISITGAETTSTVPSLLLFRRNLKVDYVIRAQRTFYVKTNGWHYRKPEEVYEVVKTPTTYERTLNASVTPFGHTIEQVVNGRLTGIPLVQ